MKKFSALLFTAVLLLACTNSSTKKEIVEAVNKKDSIVIKNFFNKALDNGQSYNWLKDLTQNIGARLSGSPQAEQAVLWGKKVMNEAGFDKVWLQPVMVPHWVRGEKEEAYFISNNEKFEVSILALGRSVATPKNGITAQVIEVNSIEEAENLGEKLKGKIVFFNKAFDPTLINTFKAYSGCVTLRYSGAKVAGKYGALGVIVRSMTHAVDNFPHTGSMSYGDLPNNQKVPTAAISTYGANLLSKHLKENPTLQFYFKQNCETLPDVLSYNVIGEITGSKYPDTYITVGGHLDSWDVGDGAHDDGAGVVQSIEVLRLLKLTNIKPKHTIRAVLFMNEENGLKGGRKYAEEAKKNNEIHIAALESDSGGFTPRGFSFDANSKNHKLFESWVPLLAPYGLHTMKKGGSGADIGPLKSDNISLFGYRPDTQRYFDYHHSEKDTFDKVNKRELELGAASIASLVYLLDNYLE